MASKVVLARCAACRHNFEARRSGRQNCPSCGAELCLDLPPGIDLPAEELPPPPEQRLGEPVPAPEGPASAAEEGREEPSEIAPEVYLPPWEDPRQGWLTRFFQTIKDVFSFPIVFFSRMRLSSIGRPVLFGWLMCTLAIACFSGYGLWAISFNREMLLQGLRSNQAFVSQGISPEVALQWMGQILRWTLFGAPVLGMVNFWLSALLIHLGVSVLAPGNRGFGATVRATAYGFAPMLLATVPMIGHLLGGLWTLVLQTVAVGQVHRIPALRAVLAVLLPLSLLMLGVFELVPRLLS